MESEDKVYIVGESNMLEQYLLSLAYIYICGSGREKYDHSKY